MLSLTHCKRILNHVDKLIFYENFLIKHNLLPTNETLEILKAKFPTKTYILMTIYILK